MQHLQFVSESVGLFANLDEFNRSLSVGRIGEQFRNYCGLKKIARCGFPWEKTTKRPVASVYTNCETALAWRGWVAA